MDNRKLFYVRYGAGEAFCATIIEAEERSAVEIYVYQEAKDLFHDIVGTNGILSLEDFVEYNHYTDTDTDVISEYDKYVEQTIYFKVEIYNIKDEEHLSTFQMQSFVPVAI